jgi:hypothetical protein
MFQQILLVFGLALCWHLAIGYWAIVNVLRLRKSALDADRHIEKLETLQRLVGGIQRELNALAAVQQQREQQEAVRGLGQDGRGPCTCNGDADEEWFWRGNAEHLP